MDQVSTERSFDVEAMLAPARQVEQYLAGFIRQRPLPANLREAISYGIFGGGKRLRPVLVIRCCEAVGGRAEQALPPAAAIELIHCFSLVHDDLPAMDDDQMRRGQPTLHVHAGEAMAILAGDAMQGLAFELLTTRVSENDRAAVLVRELSLATNDMIAGQVYDTLPVQDDHADPLEQLQNIHRHKTGALLRCASRMGAVCGGASASELSALTRYAEAVGLMFQVVDDLLDVTATADELGKATQKDADKGKLTYPGLLGMAESKLEVQRLHHQAHEALSELGPQANPLRELADYMAVRKK